MLRGLLVLALVVGLGHANHRRLLSMPGTDGLPMGLGPKAKRHVKGPRPDVIADVLPSSQALRLLSLGYKNVVADYYWLRCINDYGDKRMVAGHYPNLWPLLTRAQALDPKFVALYLFAGNTMTLRDMPWQDALTFLQTGMRERPDSWRIALNYGFNMYLWNQDLDKAARAVAAAAAHKDAPPYAGALAARMAAEAGEPEVGITIVDALLEDTRDQAQADTLRERRRRLWLEVHLKHLNHAADIYRAQHHVAPPDVQALVGLGDVHVIARDPWGAAFYIDAQGLVQSPNQNKRLRLNHVIPEASGASH